MSSIVISGDTSGSVTLQAPAVAGSTVITLPSTSTTLVSSQWTTTGSDIYYNTGNVGIGVTNPTDFNSDWNDLVVGGTGARGITIYSSNSDSTNLAFADGFTTAADEYRGLVQYAHSDNSMRFFTNATERVRINNSGYVGIGVTAPTAQLMLDGNSQTAAQTFDYSVRSATFNNYYLASDSYNAYLDIAVTANDQKSIIRFLTQSAASTNPAERARFDSSGNLLVGTTAAVYASGERVSFKSTGTNNCLGLEASTGTCLAMNMSGQASGTFVRFDSTSSARGTISTNGTTTSYNTSSDYRLKNSIASMTGALAKVALLKPVTYKWNFDGSNGEGFIAHELSEVVPDCVTGEKDAIETYTDDDGNEQTRPAYQGVDTSFLVATLTAAIQEQQALITQLTERITALEAN